MGNTRAWPVLHTVDLDEALGLTERLLSVASWYRSSGCYLDAWARDADVLRRLTEASPGARVEWYGEGRTGWPASVSLAVESFEQARADMETWAAITRCYVLWHDLKWPAVPELGLDEEYKYAELQVACNSHDIHCEEWTPEHTVFVHARPGPEDRAAWLAAQVNARVVGPSESGW